MLLHIYTSNNYVVLFIDGLKINDIQIYVDLSCYLFCYFIILFHDLIT